MWVVSLFFFFFVVVIGPPVEKVSIWLGVDRVRHASAHLGEFVRLEVRRGSFQNLLRADRSCHVVSLGGFGEIDELPFRLAHLLWCLVVAGVGESVHGHSLLDDVRFEGRQEPEELRVGPGGCVEVAIEPANK